MGARAHDIGVVILSMWRESGQHALRVRIVDHAELVQPRRRTHVVDSTDAAVAVIERILERFVAAAGPNAPAGPEGDVPSRPDDPYRTG